MNICINIKTCIQKDAHSIHTQTHIKCVYNSNWNQWGFYTQSLVVCSVLPDFLPHFTHQTGKKKKKKERNWDKQQLPQKFSETTESYLLLHMSKMAEGNVRQKSTINMVDEGENLPSPWATTLALLTFPSRKRDWKFNLLLSHTLLLLIWCWSHWKSSCNNVHGNLVFF